MKETMTMRSNSDIYSYHSQALDLLEDRRKDGSMSESNYLECKKLLHEQIADELDTLYRSN